MITCSALTIQLLRRLCLLLMAGILACGLTACGNKGKLKTPTQIEEMEAKKRAKAERQAEDVDTEGSEVKDNGPKESESQDNNPALAVTPEKQSPANGPMPAGAGAY